MTFYGSGSALDQACDALRRNTERRCTSDCVLCCNSVYSGRYVKRRRETEEVAPRPSPQRRALWAQLEAHDDATLQLHCELWEGEQGMRVTTDVKEGTYRGSGQPVSAQGDKVRKMVEARGASVLFLPPA